MPAPDASMEPGHEDREYVTGATACHACWMPQWSPVMKTGNTNGAALNLLKYPKPQWSPVMKTGNTTIAIVNGKGGAGPQWSPVMKTGNTGRTVLRRRRSRRGLNGARS